MLSQLKLLGIYQRELSKNHGCAGAALAAVAEAAVKDERENRNRPMALREFAELVQKLVIIGPLTSEQGRQLMMLQEMASTTLETAVKELDRYDIGHINCFGGGDVEWWLDYIRCELDRAHDFYQSQVK